VRAALAAILLIAAGLRSVGRNWDEGQHLHPDERFLAMVEASLAWPEHLSEVFDEARSPLNPRNRNFPSFVYGTLPTTVLKAVSTALSLPRPVGVTLAGRALSTAADLGTLLFLFAAAKLLAKDVRVALLAAFLYAVSVLPIQHAHFFVVDPFATLFVSGAVYFLARVQRDRRIADFVFMGAFFGLALACKLSVVSFAAVVVLVVGAAALRAPRRDVEALLFRLVLAGAAAFAAFRIASPDAFEGPGLLGILPSGRWLSDIRGASALVTGEGDVPPGFQWAARTRLVFPLVNMVVWGLGLPLGLAACAGWAWAARRLTRGAPEFLIPVAWTALLFLHQGTQLVMSMRYFLPIYPWLALLAAWLLVRGLDAPARRPVALGAVAVVALGSLLWAFGFTRIYTRPHTRVVASRWIYANAAEKTAIAAEQWDDALPLRLYGKDPFGGYYRGIQMRWFDEDTPEKLEQALSWLDEAELVVLSSNRVSDSVARLPMRFPMTVTYYRALFDGSLGFALVAEFTSFPTPLGLAVPDGLAEEAFSVYDHPRVRVFRKTRAYSHENAARILGSVDLATVVKITPRGAGRAPNALMLPAADVPRYRATGTWTSLFPRGGFGAAMPLASWMLTLELLGLAAFPLLHAALGALPDRGYAFAKTAGLLLVAFLGWLLASLRVAPFSRGPIVVSCALLAAAAAALVRGARVDLAETWRAKRRLLLFEEGLCWGAFLVFVLVRSANPDLWHPSMGGEKPMDLSFLLAVVKSAQFPPYDPWFAGGVLNYYYFGFVLVGTLVKLTGVVPDVAYNLAIPTLFALTVSGAFGAVLGLLPARLRTRRAAGFACLGAVAVAVLGNLGEVRLLVRGMADLSPRAATGPLGYVWKVADGLVTGVLRGKPLPFRVEWPYWEPTRAITPGKGEPGPITEMPFFTFLYGDLHAHAMALPLALLTIGVAVALLKKRAGPPRAEAAPLALAALTLGALWTTNTWDVPAYGAVLLLALLLRESDARFGERLRGAALRGLAVLSAAWALFFPFHRAYGRGYGAIERWRGSTTPLGDYLVVHGFFLFVVGAALLADLFLGRGHNAVVRLLRGALVHARHLGAWRRRVRRWVSPDRATGRVLAALRVLAAVLLVLALRKEPAAFLALLLASLAVLLLARRRPDPPWQMALALAALALSLTLAVELVVLKGDLGRANTVFKLYLEAWVLFGVVSAVAAARCAATLPRWKRPWRLVYGTGFLLLLACGLLYPLAATPSRLRDRFSPLPPTLDGAAFMEHATFRTKGVDLALSADARAIDWMREHVAGSPVIAEANTEPLLYAWGNRFTMFTGLPGIVGWSWHEVQQRGIVSGDVVRRRVEDVRTLYETRDPGEARRILARYSVAYVVLGGLERATYDAAGLSKFEDPKPLGLSLVYDADGVRIFRVEAPVA
jgi:YYY domain-containing protein